MWQDTASCAYRRCREGHRRSFPFHFGYFDATDRRARAANELSTGKCFLHRGKSTLKLMQSSEMGSDQQTTSLQRRCHQDYEVPKRRRKGGDLCQRAAISRRSEGRKEAPHHRHSSGSSAPTCTRALARRTGTMFSTPPRHLQQHCLQG
jgi:hypothetical protein